MTTRPLTDRERADILARALGMVLRGQHVSLVVNGPCVLLYRKEINRVNRTLRRAGYDEKGRRV